MRSLSLSVRNTVCCVCCFIVLCVLGTKASTLPPNPNNAALLYYQAFLLCPEPDPDSILQEDPRAVYWYDASNEDIAQYREYAYFNRHVIQLVRDATHIQQCNWAIPDQYGPEVRAERWRAIRSLECLIGANIRVLASDGDYKSALSDSLMLRRVARHLEDDSDEGIYYSTRVVVERMAFLCVNRVLDVMPADDMILKWLREQLADEPPISEPFSAKMKEVFEWQIRTIRIKGKALLSNLRQELSEKATNEEQRRKALALTEEDLLRLIREPYAKFLDTALETLDKKTTYEDKYTALQKLADEYCKQAENNPAIILTLQGNAEMLSRLYAVQATHLARFNAIKAAVEIYLLKKTTGLLPKTLPDDLPKDPLSGRDFEYKITQKGFTLRSSSHKAKDIQQYDNPQYEFRVQE